MPATNYDVMTAVQQWFLTQPTLQALFSDGQLHHKSAPEDTLLPYGTYFKVSDTADMRTTSGKVMKATVQFNVHHHTDASAQAIAETFSNALDTVTQHAVIPITVYGVNALHSLPSDFGIDVGEGLGPNGEDCWICHFTIDVPYNK